MSILEQRRRGRRVVRAHIKRLADAKRFVIAHGAEVTGYRRRALSYYDVVEGSYTHEHDRATLFLYAKDAKAIVGDRGENIRVLACDTRIVKGRRVATSLPEWKSF